MAKTILILSPHLDDSMLSCADHVAAWIHQGSSVSVVNIFTSYSATTLSLDAQQCLTELSLSSVQKYETIRKNEDKAAIKELNVQFSQNLDLVDGGFRTNNGIPVYPSFSELFKRRILDPEIISLTVKKIKHLHKFDRIFIPLGVGNHVDHLIVKLAAEQTFPAEKIGYYAEAPYLLKWKNWRINQVPSLLLRDISIKYTTHKKLSILKHYSSQIPRLFQQFPLSYPEILASPKYEIPLNQP